MIYFSINPTLVLYPFSSLFRRFAASPFSGSFGFG